MVTYTCDNVHEAFPGNSYKSECLDCWFSLTNNSSQIISYNFNNAMQGIENFNADQVWVCCSSSSNQTLLSSLNPQQQNEILTGTLDSGQSCWNKFVFVKQDSNSTLQAGSIPLLTIAGSPVTFWFWSGGSTFGQGSNQYININETGLFAITKDSDTINVAVGLGFSIVLDGGGGALKTNNICITVADCPGAYSLSSWLGNYFNNTYESSTQSPSLTIQTLEDNSYQVTLDSSVINSWTYDATKSQLSWSAEDGNCSSATLTFSFNSDNQPQFTGNLQMVAPDTPNSGTFSGTICNPESLNTWLGNYPNNTYTPWAQPPSLTIHILDDNTYRIALDGSVINNWTYDAATYQLSWSAEDGNWSAASLNFSFNSDNQAQFTGNLQIVAPETPESGTFSGTISN